MTINQLAIEGLASPAAASPRGKSDSPAKIADAAQQFESLLLSQVLRSAREGGQGWLGTGEEDSASDCATDFAEQQFAVMLARSGGLGLARLIGAGLEAKAATASDHSTGEENTAPSVR